MNYKEHHREGISQGLTLPHIFDLDETKIHSHANSRTARSVNEAYLFNKYPIKMLEFAKFIAKVTITIG